MSHRLSFVVIVAALVGCHDHGHNSNQSCHGPSCVCDEGSDDCIYDCSGDGCAEQCDSFNNSCQTTCDDDCSVECNSGPECDVSAGDGANVQCTNTNICTIEVGDQSTVECDTDDCEVQCDGACVVQYDTSTTVDVTCSDGTQRRDCGDGTYRCDTDCD